MVVCFVNSRRHLLLVPLPYRGASRDPRQSLNCRSICASHLPSFLSNLQRSAVKPFRSNSFRIITYKNRHFARFWHRLSPFRINTSKGVSKQRTLSIFRMNTYEKQGEGGPVIVNQKHDLSSARKLPHLTTIRASRAPAAADARTRELGLRFDLVGSSVPGDGGFAEIGLVGHVAGEGGVVAEDGVFCDLLMIAHTLEKSPEVRFFSVPGFAAKSKSLLHRLLAGLGIVVLVPFLEIGFAHRLRIPVSVIAGRFVFAGLWEVGDGVFGNFEDALGTLEAVDLWRIAAKIEAEINGRAAVIEERGVDIRHIAAVWEAKDAAESHSLLWWGIPAEHEVHAADKMDEQIAGQAGAVFLPAAPARENIGIEGDLGNLALPSVPIEICGREIGRRRIFPRAGGIVAAKRAFDESERADDAVGEKLFGFGTNDGADALRADFHDAASLLRGSDHGDTVGGGMGHGLFTVDIFSGVDGVDDHLLVPMIGDGGDEAVDFLVIEEIFVAARGGDFPADNFLGECVAAVVEIASGDAFDAGKLDGVAEQTGALHADTDDAEAQAVARRGRLQG